MKKLSLFLAIPLIALSGCKKEEIPEPQTSCQQEPSQELALNEPFSDYKECPSHTTLPQETYHS